MGGLLVCRDAGPQGRAWHMAGGSPCRGLAGRIYRPPGARFSTLTDLRLTDPETGISWQAPFFQVLSLSYKPNHLIAVWPNEQQIATPREKFTLKTANMRASLKVKPSTQLGLDTAQIDSEGWTAGFDTLNAAIRLVGGAGSTYDVATTIDQLLPGERVRKVIDQGGTLPETIETLRYDLQVALDAPLDRTTIEAARPNITNLNIRELRGTWGALEAPRRGCDHRPKLARHVGACRHRRRD